MLTAQQLQAATGATPARAALYLDLLNSAMATMAIDTPPRMAAFLAQIGHESVSLAFAREIWGPTAQQLSYEGRKDLGNVKPGDGLRYLGRGLIQVTGRANYAAATTGMRAYAAGVPDFEANPALLEQPQWAALSAGWYWRSRGLSALADVGQFELITKRINGGLTGQPDRLVRWGKAKAALGVK
jgi:putative chitinase